MENNKGVYILLKNFKNYFTINFDPFLYLLLIKYSGKNNNSKIIGFNTQLRNSNLISNVSKEADLLEILEDISENGVIIYNLNPGREPVRIDFNRITQLEAIKALKTYLKPLGYNLKDYQLKQLFLQIKQNENSIIYDLEIDDGSIFKNGNQGNLFEFNLESTTQNLFFLHGAFHIFKENNRIFKITQTENAALYDRLEKIINSEKKDLVCVFKGDNKFEEIKDNPYLSKCLNKLGDLTGNLVIIGCSFSDNDKHIFEKINESNIDKIYISVLNDFVNFEKQIRKLITKPIQLFDAETITYSA